ncbi:TonB-dependent receptor [Oxalobacteraceae bacterium]|nr:TonB-dependent receptor [Oxalobacteraceae bacterium]
MCILLAAAPAQAGGVAGEDLINLSLEELSDFRVTSVSKKEERLADAPAAIYVITGEAIQRAGARSLPEALRLAPNLQVAQINASQYAISARGFNSSTANKLLVMIDGRTVYTPLYSGVFWDAQNTMLLDIDRIEVVSGPGGTVWGTNAVNGVINVISKTADKTVGQAARFSGGSNGSGVEARHGAVFDGGAYRLYLKGDRWRATQRANGAANPDAWSSSQAGLRSDWHGALGDFSLLADVYQGAERQSAPGAVRIAGANTLLRWDRNFDGGAHLHAQAYLDRTTRQVPGTYGEALNTLDLELQYSSAMANGLQSIVGGGYRIGADRVDNSAFLAFLPARRKLHWANLFGQQERALGPDLRLISGLRLESNDYTGIEWLPSVKLAWKPQAERTVWLGLARSVRAPSRLDTELYAPAKAPFLVAGGPQFRSEIAYTLELGLRGQSANRWTYALAGFLGRYQRLRSFGQDSSGAYVLENRISGQMRGLEANAGYQATPDWQLEGAVTLLRSRFDGPVAQSMPGDDPRVQLGLRSKWNFGGKRQFDLALRHVGALPAPAVSAYTVLDLHLGLPLSARTELRLGARNLLDRRHTEYPSGSGAALANPIVIERALDLTLTARF